MTTPMKTKQSGAVLLIAILVSSVVLAVGFGVYQRTYKQLLIGSFWKQVQIAFASADAGLECAAYWDKKYPQPSGTTSASCFGDTFEWFNNGGWNKNMPGQKEWSKCLEIGNDGHGSVQIRVIKQTDGRVVIETRGYNTSCSSESSRRVERGRFIIYYVNYQ